MVGARGVEPPASWSRSEWTLDEEVARWARVRAAELDTSLSRLVGQMLKEHMLADKGYDTARRRYLSRKATPISTAKYPRRDDLHDR